MIKTVLLLTGLALVHARSNGDAVVNNARINEPHLENGCPADFDIEYLLPHEECEKYYQCDDGEKIERDCQVGTVFNSAIQACDWPYNVPQCEESPGATAPPPAPDNSDEVSVPDDWEALPNGCPADYEIDYLLPHESNCSNYYACDNGELVEMECPPGLHFRPSKQMCSWPNEAGCENWSGPADTIILKSSDTELQEDWEALPNGCPSNYTIDHLLPHEYDCEKFYYCVHGGKVEFSCAPNGTHFSSALQKCTWPEEAGCEKRDSSGPVPVQVKTRTAYTDCPECPPWPVNPADRCKDGCNVAPWPHPECDKYYFCVGDQFRLGICAEGLHFNPSTLTCDFICNAGCARIIPQITRHADGLLTFVPNAWGNTGKVMDMIERELNAEL